MTPADVVRGVGTASWLIARAGTGIVADAGSAGALTQTRFADALATYLWRPLPLLLGLALLTGVITGTIAARLLGIYHAELAIEPLLVRTLCRDILPILFGLFVSGRIAVELAARLAATAVAREVEALEILGHDPVRYLLSPALAAVVVAVPVHLLAAAAAAVASTGWTIALSGETRWATFQRLTLDQTTAQALATGMAKGLVFALIAFGTGAAVGSLGARGAAEIGARATRAFTIALLAVFAVATLWAVFE